MKRRPYPGSARTQKEEAAEPEPRALLNSSIETSLRDTFLADLFFSFLWVFFFQFYSTDKIL